MLRGGGICEYNRSSAKASRESWWRSMDYLSRWNGCLAVSNISRNISGFDDLLPSHLPLSPTNRPRCRQLIDPTIAY